VQDKILHALAQGCILLYRGFEIRKRFASMTHAGFSAFCRKEFGDTAD
jgi:hypothetical protein